MNIRNTFLQILNKLGKIKKLLVEPYFVPVVIWIRVGLVFELLINIIQLKSEAEKTAEEQIVKTVVSQHWQTRRPTKRYNQKVCGQPSIDYEWKKRRLGSSRGKINPFGYVGAGRGLIYTRAIATLKNGLCDTLESRFVEYGQQKSCGNQFDW